VITGTADILPGFLDEWEMHTLPHQRAEAGQQWLWVGKDVDHYFGKLIGRLSNDASSQKDQFAEALVDHYSLPVRFADHEQLDHDPADLVRSV